DGVQRAVIFSQYPQYSCATTGSSLNAIADFYKNRQLPNIKFSLIERWATNRLLAQVFAERIREKLELFDRRIRDQVLIMFTAHSLPLKPLVPGGPAISGSGSGYGNGGARGVKNLRQRF
ncbi:jg12201, partial [Pararge aegeria aegeria]